MVTIPGIAVSSARWTPASLPACGSVVASLVGNFVAARLLPRLRGLPFVIFALFGGKLLLA